MADFVDAGCSPLPTQLQVLHKPSEPEVCTAHDGRDTPSDDGSAASWQFAYEKLRRFRLNWRVESESRDFVQVCRR